MHSWPLFELRLTTPRLTLRLPSDGQLDTLAKQAVGRVLPPERVDFVRRDWTQFPSPEFERRFLQYHWRTRANWTPEAWTLSLVAFADGEPIGDFALTAERFAETRTVTSGSWLLPEWRGRRLGVEGRAALLTLAFEGLGAHAAHSEAHEDNGSSLGVSAALGYERTGVEEGPGLSGRTVRRVQVQLTRERWAAQARPAVDVDGLDACRALFGA